MSDLILCYSPIFPIRIENENSSHEDTVFDINHDTTDNNKTINDNNNIITFCCVTKASVDWTVLELRLHL